MIPALAVTAALVGATAGAAGATAATSTTDPMRDAARHVLAAGAPGYMARIDTGRRVTVTAAGVADRATGRTLNGREQFEIGSNTKTFMAALTLQLVDQRKVDLDASVERYLPGVVPNGRAITVRMLLNHTSGLFNYTSDPDFFTDMEKDPQRVLTSKELLEVAFRNDPTFAPGAGWSYSNTNYILTGMILEKLTRTSLPDLVQQRIARPLGLTKTYFADPRATSTGRGYAHGYAVRFAGGEPEYTDTSSWPIGGWGGAAGAIISTQEDLATFFAALMRGELFSQRQLAQMKTTVEIPESFGMPGGYGLGLFRKDTACGTVWGHGGDTMGHHSLGVVTADGSRTAVGDVTAEPADTGENPGVNRYYRVVMAADEVAVCRMLGKPVPAEVLAALHS
ncbi:serine hydrolase [Actinoplanes sp. NBRC 101535]|nr:serine hydrolase [Actinoplanes sp. NBRC 101535]